jgi:cobalt-zinc-cadmium efflux system membrane fusion protein
MKNILIKSMAFIFLAACGNGQSTNEEPTKTATQNIVELTEAQSKNAEIETGTLQQMAISAKLKVNGKIELPPQNVVSVSVPLGGYLKSTKLLEGVQIKKGEVIAVMEDQQYIQLQQDYLTAKAHFSSVEAEYQRQKDLNISKASSDKVFENAQSEYLSQKILIKSLSEKLKLIGINPANLDENKISKSINIYSPIDGFVAEVKQNIGKYVSPTDVLFELINPTDIYLALTVFEKDLDNLFIGQKIIAYNNQSSKKYNCEIFLIGKDISDERAVVVHCRFVEYDKALIPGMYMNAEAEISTNTAFVISEAGLVGFEGKEYVFIKTEKNKYNMQEVIAQNTENGFTQIRFPDNEDLANKIFVTKGAYTLLMTMKNIDE